MLALLTAVMTGTGCASLSKDADVRLTGDETGLAVQWTASHPWAPQLPRQAAQWHLYAQYRSTRQPFEQDLGQARALGDDGWQFALPATLKRIPDDQVCLFIADPRSGLGFPVRLGDIHGRSTGRFRNPSWEGAVTAATRRQALEEEATSLQVSADRLAETLATARATLHQRGIESAADCAKTAATSPGRAGPAPTAEAETPPAQQEATTHRLCVRRARNIRRLTLKNGESVLDMAAFIGKAQAQGRFAPGDRLAPQADAFLQDWANWYERTGAEYVPELGAEDALLPMGEVLQAGIKAWIADGRRASPEVERQLAGGLLDAYGACLEDVGKQLQVKWQESQQARAARPMREQLYAERKQAACEAEVHRVNDLDAAAKLAQAKASEIHDRLRDGASPATPSALHSQVRLNEVPCDD